MPFLFALRDAATPFFDTLFSLITHLGEETVFLALAIFVFWCVNKRAGYFVLITGLVGTVLNQFLKIFFRIPRPWVLSSEFSELVVDDAIAEATGYSFPSGHTQNIAGTFGSLALYFKKHKPFLTCSIVIILLVAFSRMYLGVHTPLDVLVSLVIAAVLVFALYPLFASEERFERSFPFIVIASVVLSLCFLIYVISLSNDAALDTANYHSAMKNACTLFGCTLGLIAVFFVDTKITRFDTRAPWYAQLLKLVLGLAIVLGIKSGLSSPLTHLFGNEMVARAVRYFLIVVFAGCVWPLTFKFFSSLKCQPLDSFGEKCARLFARSKNKE